MQDTLDWIDGISDLPRRGKLSSWGFDGKKSPKPASKNGALNRERREKYLV
jgi:hypothetical protein